MAERNKADRPLAVDLPAPDADRPSWVRVGVIAVIGFVIGVAWPKIAGVRLGPSAPSEANNAAVTAPVASGSTAPAASAPAASLAATNTPAASASAETPPPAPLGSAATGGAPSVNVGHGILLSCRTEEGTTLKGKECGALGFDALAQPRLKHLDKCAATDGAEGKLAVTFALDFQKNTITPSVGHKTSVGNVDSIGMCIRGLFEKVSLSAVDHDNPKYGVLYNVTFGAKPAGSSPTAATPASTGTPAAAIATDDGAAQVVWEVAIVRDQPRTGSVVTRLQRGTKVQIGQMQDNWYKVHTANGDGWVYRAALGK